MDYSAPSKAFLLVQLLLLFTCLSLPVAFSQGRRSRLRSLPPAHSPIEENHGRHPLPLHPPVHRPISHHHHHDHHGHGHPAPVHPPVHPPSHHDDHGHAPSHAPVHPPAPSLASPPPPYVNPWLEQPLGAVQGVVYCKSCQYAGKNALNSDAKPISGAVVKLQCKNSRYPTEAMARTDEHGYFFLQAPKAVSTYAAHKCKVYLVSSPLPTCSLPSDLNGGVTGATLRSVEIDFALYTVGPFAFEPKCKL